jgi:hypothetical protein
MSQQPFSSDNGFSTTGNITAGYLVGNGVSITGITSSSNIISNGTSNVSIPVANGNITINSSNGDTWNFDNAGNLTVPGNIVGAATVAIDNRASGNGADINLYAADDITIQARDRGVGSTSEGGDINIFAGDSAEDSDSSGGDIQIIAGDGGNANVDFAGLGGFVTIAGGRGGNASTGVGNYLAEDGGELTLRAGDAGNNNGNIDRGADGGAVLIEAGDSTGNGINGGGITLTTGLGGTNALAGYVEINIPSSDLGAGGTWIFTGTGNLNLPTNGSLNLSGGGINQDNNETLLITTFDDDGIVGSSLEMEPGSTTRLEQWSNQQSDTFTTADWATGTYTNQGGMGKVQFTSAANIIAFIDSLVGTGHIYFSVNGGTQLLLDGTSSGGGNITFFTPTLPAVDPTVVTSFEYFYSYNSGFEIVSGEGTAVNIYANDADITLQTTGQQDISLDSSGDVILTANSTVNWTFATTGNLTLPGNTFAVNYANGTQVSIGGGGASTGNVTFDDISIIGTGNLKLQPDSANVNAYLDIYLTGGPDIHIAGNGETVILGTDDYANVAVNVDGNVSIQAGNVGGTKTWTFGTDSNLTLPQGTTISDSTDIVTVTLDQFTDGGYPGTQVFTKVSDTLYELSPGGPYMTLISGIWYLKISVSTYYNSTDLITWETVAGGLPTPVGTLSSLATMNLGVGVNTWAFGEDGDLTFPTGNLVITPVDAVFGNSAVIASEDHNLITLSTGANGGLSSLWVEDIGNVGTSNIAAVYANPTPGSKIVRIAVGQNGGGGGPNLWDFDASGNATFPANGTTNLHDVVSVGLATFSNVQIGGNLNYEESANLIVVEDKDSFADIIAQNKNSGANASMNIVLVNNDPGNVYMAMGVNSSNFTPLYNTLFEIPDAGYCSHSTTQVMGPQSAESGNSNMFFTYSSGSYALELNANGAIGWGASYNGNLTSGNFGNVGQVLTSAGANSPPTWNDTLSVVGNVSAGNITGNKFIGNGALLTNVVEALVKPNNLLYVAKNGNDTSGTGSINAPYLTIQAAINAAAGDTATTIILAPGSYVENLTIANVANSLNITGSGLAESAINGNIVISGTSDNIEFDNFRISTGRVTHSATGYWSVLNLRFSANTGITKTSSSTIKIFNTDLGAAGTGNILLQGGKTNIYSSQIFNVQVSGATTEVNFLQCDTVILPTVTAGNVNFIDTNIVSSGTGNSLTATGGNVTLKNCLSITPTRTLAPMNFGASSRFSYGDSAFDYANTTFAGTAIIQPSQSQSINVRGGNILTTGQISATGNVTGNFFIGNGSQLTGISAGSSNSISNGTSNVSIPAANGNVTITSNSGNTWTFDNTGNITIPSSSGGLIKTVANGAIGISAMNNGTDNPAQLMSWRTTQANPDTIVSTYANSATIMTDVNGTIKTWAFSNTGNLTLPSGGNLIVSGAIVSSGASPAPSLSGFSSVNAITLSASGNITAGNLSVTGNVTSNISFTGANITINNAPGGNEGAEIFWALPSAANTVLNTSLIQDVYQNGMRFFEAGGNSRGLYMDLGNVPNGSATAVGYRDVPQVAFTANTTITTTDAGRHYYSTLSTGNVLTIANNASQGLQVGAAISIINQGTGNITVAQGSGVTLYLAGNATSGNRTVATFGMATLIKVATDTWFINGTGVS